MFQYKIEKATKKDGEEILELIEKTSSKGKLELIYTRRPNPYVSYKEENPDAEIFIVRDENNKIALQVATEVRNYYINNKLKQVAYVGGLRKNPEFKGNFHWTKMLHELDKNILKYHDFYCSILKDNKHASDVLLKKRKNNWFSFNKICDYTTNIFNPSAVINKKDWDNNQYTLKKVTEEYLKDIYEFINKERKNYSFFPEIKSLENFKDLKVEDSYILVDQNNKIVAFTSLWNQSSFKQYVIKKYHFPLNILKSLSFIFERIRYISFPSENQTFQFSHLSFLLVNDNSINIYKTFLYKICCDIYITHKALVIGISNEVIQNEIYNYIKKISFDSTIYYIHSKKSEDLSNNPYIECALL